MYGYCGLAAVMETSMSYHFNEAAKACQIPGVSLKVVGAFNDAFYAGTRALVEVTYPDQSVGSIAPTLRELPHLINMLPDDAAENRQTLATSAKQAIQDYEEEQARQRQEDWDKSSLGKIVAWAGRHFHL